MNLMYSYLCDRTLASTKDSVHILQYQLGQEQIKHSDFWIDRLGNKNINRLTR